MDGTIFVDVRPESRWKAGHIKGAKALSHFLEPETEAKAANRSRIVVLYCESATCLAAVSAARKLGPKASNLAVYTGGWAEWSRLGLPISSD
jgi:rhodanese-related sulfurtransferase